MCRAAAAVALRSAPLHTPAARAWSQWLEVCASYARLRAVGRRMRNTALVRAECVDRRGDRGAPYARTVA